MKKVRYVHKIKDTDTKQQSNLFLFYSRYKHGSMLEIQKVAENISELIKKDIYQFKNKEIVLTTVPYSSIPSPIALSTKIIAKKLNMPFVKISIPSEMLRTRTYEKLNSKKERDKENKYLRIKKKYTGFKNKMVIIIDDSFVTGSTTDKVQEILLSKLGASEVRIYVFMKIITPNPSYEYTISSWIKQKKYFEEFIALLSNEHLQINRYLLKSLFQLPPGQLRKIANLLSRERKKLLVKYARIYFSSENKAVDLFKL